MINYVKSFLYSVLYFFSFINRFFLRDKLIYVCHHNFPGNIGPLYKIKRGKLYITQKANIVHNTLTEYDYINLKPGLSYFTFIFDLIFSKNIIIDDSLVSMGRLNFSPKQKIIQVWHACGAFKKFGYTSLHNRNKNFISPMYEKYSAVSVSSEAIRKEYSDSFKMPVSKVLALGVPRTDLYFDCEFRNDVEKKFFIENPILKNKKIILYAPTFREKNSFQQENLNKLNEVRRTLEDDYHFIYAMHPYESDVYIKGVPKNFNFTSKYDFFTLSLISDILITDYSSVIFEYSLLSKPIFFYTPDLEDYTSRQRGFFYDFKDFAPGFFSDNIFEIIKEIKRENFELERINRFSGKFMSACDGNSAQRIINYINEKE